MFGPAIEKLEPRLRNSNLLPVKAKGEVRLRSVVSRLKRGVTFTPMSRRVFSCAETVWRPSMAVSISVRSSPRNIEMMAGGASLAPRR